jgi:hypothetical protein
MKMGVILMKFLDKSFNVLLISGACSILVACGGGSDAPSSPEVLTGVFIDSPVSGITYKTATQSGVTDVDGKFKYISGEKVTFSIGAIVLPETLAKDIVTPLDMDPSGDVTSNVVSNILVLLQSLDSSGTLADGIQIPADAKNKATSSVDFTVTPTAFIENASVLSLIEPGKIVSLADAINHFQPPTTTSAYTLYKPDLTVASVSVTSTTSGASVANSIPLTPNVTATYTTSDGGDNYTWSGVVGGNVKANGNVALACTANNSQSGYVAVSSQATPVTDVTKIYGKTFAETSCGNSSTLTVSAAGSITISGETEGYTTDEAGQIFSTNGLTIDGETIRGAIYSFTVGSETRYFYVIRVNETEGKSVFIGVQQ